jgi:hypothetical protein
VLKNDARSYPTSATGHRRLVLGGWSWGPVRETEGIDAPTDSVQCGDPVHRRPNPGNFAQRTPWWAMGGHRDNLADIARPARNSTRGACYIVSIAPPKGFAL